MSYHLLFARNAHILTEQLRTALLRTFDRADAMFACIRELLENEGNRVYHPLDLREEICNASMISERVHGAFTEGVGAIATPRRPPP